MGKFAVALAPPEPELQHAALRLTARGWETAPLPAPDGSGALVVALDLRTHEVAVGWWPGDGRNGKAAFYAYAHPALHDFSATTLSPAAVRWEPSLGEFVLHWDDVRSSPDRRRPRSERGLRQTRSGSEPAVASQRVRRTGINR